MLLQDIENGQLVKYMSRLLLVLNKEHGRVYDGFIECLEVGETRPAMYNLDALEPLEKEDGQKF